MTRASFFVTAALCLCLFSCSGEKPSGIAQGPSDTGAGGGQKAVTNVPLPSAAGGYSLELAPVDASRTSTLFLLPKGFNLPDAEMEWRVNGHLVPTQAPNQLNASELKRGDKVEVRATLKNGETILSNTVQIKNSPPELRTTKMMPEVFKPGDTLSIEATSADPDGDDVSISYEWSINGQPAGSTNKLEGKLTRGDKIVVKMTPFDGEASGRPVILKREVTNMPPMIIDDKKFNFDGKVWTYQVKATDPDNDPLTYSLKSGPAGMTINSSTGLIQWNVPPDFTGKAAAGVSVSDGHGGEAIYHFNVNMKVEPPKPK